MRPTRLLSLTGVTGDQVIAEYTVVNRLRMGGLGCRADGPVGRRAGDEVERRLTRAFSHAAGETEPGDRDTAPGR